MTPMTIILTFTMIWMVTFFISLPIGVHHNHQESIKGTDSGAPNKHGLKKKTIYSLIIAATLTVIYSIIINKFFS